MANIIHDTTAPANTATGLVLRLRQVMAQRRMYTKVLTELASMTDRELTDINLTRGDIRRVAREAAEL